MVKKGHNQSSQSPNKVQQMCHLGWQKREIWIDKSQCQFNLKFGPPQVSFYQLLQIRKHRIISLKMNRILLDVYSSKTFNYRMQPRTHIFSLLSLVSSKVVSRKSRKYQQEITISQNWKHCDQFSFEWSDRISSFHVPVRQIHFILSCPFHQVWPATQWG